MAYYDALVAKWASLSGSPEERLAAVNALTVEGPRRLVPIAEAMEYLRARNLWLPIKAAASTKATAAAVTDLNADPRAQAVDFQLPVVQGLLAGLVTDALLTQPQADALEARSHTQIPWWASEGYTSPIGPGDLTAAGLD